MFKYSDYFKDIRITRASDARSLSLRLAVSWHVTTYKFYVFVHIDDERQIWKKLYKIKQGSLTSSRMRWDRIR